MKKKKSKLKEICSIIVAFLLMISSIIIPDIVHATNSENIYLGWTEKLTGFDEAIYVIPQNKEKTIENSIVAYCFNFTFATPPYTDSNKEYPEYIKEKGSSTVFNSLAKKARITGDDLYNKLNKVLYNGYPHNASDIQGELTDARFRAVTQYAVWYYTDSKNLEDLKLGTDEKNVFEKLVGLKEGAKDAPADLTFDIYRNNMRVKASTDEGAEKPDYQHLISVTPVNNKTGEEKDIELTTDVYAKKVWEGTESGDKKPDVNFVLKNALTKEKINVTDNPKNVSTTENNESKIVKWENLPGRASDYIIEEEGIPAGYALKQVSGSGKEEDPYVIINEKKSVPQHIQSIRVIKNWKDINGSDLTSNKTVYFALYKKVGTNVELVKESSGKSIENPKPFQINSYNTPTPPLLWDKVYLPTKTNPPNDGETIEYFVKEVDENNEDWKEENFITSEPTYKMESSNMHVTFINQKVDSEKYKLSKPISITANKIWKGGTVSSSEKIKFQLQRKLEDEKDFNNISGGNVLVGIDNTHTWNNLPQIDKNGKKYVYNVIESRTESGYIPSVAKSDDGKTFTITNTYEEPEVFHDIKIIKKSGSEEGKTLEGATLKLLNIDENNKKIAEWKTTNEAKSFSLKAGNYKLVEVNPPTGYKTADDITFRMSTDGKIYNGEKEIKDNALIMVDEPDTINLEITKVWEGIDESIAPEITVYLVKNGKKTEQRVVLNSEKYWLAKFENLPVKDENSLIINEYTVVEDGEKDGYINLNGDKFQVIYNKGEITNKKVDSEIHKVKISKRALTENGEELPGAELKIKNEKGEVVESWISGVEPKEFSLESGNYKLVETAAPQGYEMATEINFSITKEGKVMKGDVEITGDAPIVMVDAAKEYSVSISKKALTESGDELEGASLEIRDAKANDKIIKSWKSKSTPEKFTLLPGSYKLVETAAPQGYEIATTINFTVEKDGKVKVGEKILESNAPIVMVDKLSNEIIKHTVKISKRALTENGEELPGAELKIKNEKGEVVESWISGTEPKEFSLESGNYKLVETAAPQGYEIATEISFSITKEGTVMKGDVEVTGDAPIVMVDAAKEYNVSISKKALTESGDELEGASLEIRDAKANDKIIKSWKSKSTPEKFTLLPGSYKLVETAAPQGYEIATTINFTVEKDGKVKVGEKILESNAPIVMVDKLSNEIIKHAVKISKRALTENGEELSGAELKIKNEKGEVVESWISGAEPKEFSLESGNYKLVETAAPQGYEIATTINFTVEKDGKVKIGEKILESNAPIVMVDKLSNEIIKHAVKISKRALTENGEELPGAKLQIKNEKGEIVESWISGVEPKEFSLESGNYKLVETAAPQGYEIATTINFTVEKDGKVKVGEKILESNAPIVMVDKLSNEIIKHTVKISKRALTENGEELPGAKLQIKNEKGEVVESWISGAEPKEFSLESGSYKLVETAAPQGYEMATEINFSITKEGKVMKGDVEITGDAPIVMVDKLLSPAIPLEPTKEKLVIKKVWEGIEASNAPEVKIYLVKNGVKTNQTLILNKNNHWMGEFINLPDKDITSGKSNIYTVIEEGTVNGKVTINGNKYSVSIQKDGTTVNIKNALLSLNKNSLHNEENSKENIKEDTVILNSRYVKELPKTGDTSDKFLYTGMILLLLSYMTIFGKIRKNKDI